VCFFEAATINAFNQGSNPGESIEKIALKEIFTYWTNHLKFSDKPYKFDLLKQTMQKKNKIFSWFLHHLLFSYESGVRWQILSLKSFFYTIV